MATRVQFYHNAEHPLALACEFAARAVAGGRKIALRVADEPMARELDRMLWNFDPLEFVPHVMADSPLAAETPVVIGRADAQQPWPETDMLLNLADDIPEGFERFRMLVEIVGQSETQKQPARMRWKHYKQQDLRLQAFDAVRREAL
ncbi:MAG: DNA polymerase III subunit chi [Aromatoleum sp.]|jgi:DNA polymerase-3 subunit chi|uniref:DNA polymerase III subunit chi n=1 Tax=Aromatoleum sp. TaxID=2307007 RepID=UPI0028943FC0|nr:DNA polymerase III subunit chi [Aromatoleum sp.]MDT3669668.1 DNA polymerase III subunit chi [Aromatoleum sp.]